MFQIEIKKKALKVLLKMPANQRALIMKKVEEYVSSPSEGHNVIKLTERSGYRMRIGDWRVIFDKDEEHLLIMVLEVGSRGGIYQ